MHDKEALLTEALELSDVGSEHDAEAAVRAVREIDGVDSIGMHWPDSTMIVSFDDRRTAVEDVKTALGQAGYAVRKIDLGGNCDGLCCGGSRCSSAASSATETEN